MVIGLISVMIWIYILVWIYRDAEERGRSGVKWVLIALICGWLGCLIWLLVRPSTGSSAGAGEYLRKGDAISLGHEAGASGMKIPKGSDAVEHSMFGEGGYFTTHTGFDEEEEDYDDEDHDEDDTGEVTLPSPPPPPDPSDDDVSGPAFTFADDEPVLPGSDVPPPMPEDTLAAPKLPVSQPSSSGSVVEIDDSDDPESSGDPESPMDMATIACPGCSHQFEVPSTGGLQTITCPACGLSGDVEV